MPNSYTGPYKMGTKTEQIDMDHIIKGFNNMETEEKRELRLDVSVSCSEQTCNNGNCRVAKILDKSSYCFGQLKDEMIRDNSRRYKFNTIILPSEMCLDENDDIHIEEGETTISMYKDNDHCKLRVHTQAVLGNGGLVSIDLRPLENLNYT